MPPLLQLVPVAKECWAASTIRDSNCSPECSAVALPFGKECFVSAVTYEGLGVKTDVESAGAFYDRCAAPAPAPAPAPGSAAPPVSDAEASWGQRGL